MGVTLADPTPHVNPPSSEGGNSALGLREIKVYRAHHRGLPTPVWKRISKLIVKGLTILCSFTGIDQLAPRQVVDMGGEFKLSYNLFLDYII
mgnify:CR=1 FL=1